MAWSEIIKEQKQKHVIDELAALDYHDVEGKSYEQLIKKLTDLRALNVNHDVVADKWF